MSLGGVCTMPRSKPRSFWGHWDLFFQPLSHDSKMAHCEVKWAKGWTPGVVCDILLDTFDLQLVKVILWSIFPELSCNAKTADRRAKRMKIWALGAYVLRTSVLWPWICQGHWSVGAIFSNWTITWKLLTIVGAKIEKTVRAREMCTWVRRCTFLKIRP